jgi:hypothetical protein
MPPYDFELVMRNLQQMLGKGGSAKDDKYFAPGPVNQVPAWALKPEPEDDNRGIDLLSSVSTVRLAFEDSLTQVNGPCAGD